MKLKVTFEIHVDFGSLIIDERSEIGSQNHSEIIRRARLAVLSPQISETFCDYLDDAVTGHPVGYLLVGNVAVGLAVSDLS
jgi:tetrahydromethanopterin S-methyltransferase subunit E